MFRIQKLMLEEFRSVYEPIIVENPFTQVTENGEGVRQFHIGLTRTKLIFGCDDFEETDLDDIYCRDRDAEIETFQLVNLLPLEFVRFNFFRKHKRDIMRIIICGEEDRPLFFEFGGHLYKKLFWSTWRQSISSIHLMHPDLLHISGSSPFSSTDVVADEETCYAQVHICSDSYLEECSLSLCACSQY